MGTRKAIHSLKRQRGNAFLMVGLALITFSLIWSMSKERVRSAEVELACTATGEYGVREDRGEKQTTAPLLKKVQKYNCTDGRVRWYPVEEPK